MKPRFVKPKLTLYTAPVLVLSDVIKIGIGNGYIPSCQASKALAIKISSKGR
jgi:hypothetical protein